MIHNESWFVYIVRCCDGTLYTGITRNLDRRIAEHNSGAGGARYTRGRRPVTLVYAEPGPSRAAVCSREARIKKLTLRDKLALIGERAEDDS